MREVLIAAAKTLPLKELVRELAKACDKYEEEPSESTEKGVTMWVYMISIKMFTKGKSTRETLDLMGDDSEFFGKVRELAKNGSKGENKDTAQRG